MTQEQLDKLLEAGSVRLLDAVGAMARALGGKDALKRATLPDDEGSAAPVGSRAVSVRSRRPKGPNTTERDALHDRLHDVVTRTEVSPRAPRRLKHYTVHAGVDSPDIQEIEPTDLLVIDTVHHADRLLGELGRFAGQVRKRIALRGTQQFGEIAEGGKGPGLLAGLRRWLREHPEWSVIYHAPEQYGLTVISRDPKDKPKLPGVLTLASNFAKAVAEHVSDGLQHVTGEQLEARLQICSLCDVRRDTRCAACGCFLQPKAGMRSSVCPLGKWPELPAVVTRSEAA
jgi:hypothetical protein